MLMMMLLAMMMMMTMQGVLYLRTEIFSEMQRYKNVRKGLFQNIGTLSNNNNVSFKTYVKVPFNDDDDDDDIHRNDAQRPFQRELYDLVLTMDRF